MNTRAEHRAALSARFCRVYHKEEFEAEREFEYSEFYRVLSAKDRPLLVNTPEEDFILFQNEIKYGCRNRLGAMTCAYWNTSCFCEPCSLPHQR